MDGAPDQRARFPSSDCSLIRGLGRAKEDEGRPTKARHQFRICRWRVPLREL